jgi:hypothetical protein
MAKEIQLCGASWSMVTDHGGCCQCAASRALSPGSLVPLPISRTQRLLCQQRSVASATPLTRPPRDQIPEPRRRSYLDNIASSQPHEEPSYEDQSYAP